MDNTDAVVAKFVAGKSRTLFKSTAALAKLRRGVGKKPGELPELLEYILLPDEDASPIAEQAVYTALTLYALHQQGQSRFMGTSEDKEGVAAAKINSSFGHAIKKLAAGGNEIAVKRRFDKILTSRDLVELAVHARGLIGLLKKADIAINYADFAKDLYWFQQNDYRRNVILKWGQDYYRNNKRREV